MLEPKALTNFTQFDKTGKHAISSIGYDNNLIIKGNNLIALHTIKPIYEGRVKLIYIDPPFNTDNDSFQYNDSFTHSTWLTFMKNRIEVARELLKPEGLMFIHVDNIEEAYIKVMMDEVFGRDNFINSIAVRSSTPSGTKTKHKDKTIIKQKDYIIIYRRSSSASLNPQYKRKTEWDTHFNYFLDRETGTVMPLLDVLIENKLLPQGSSLKDFNINDKKSREFYLKNATLICQTQSHKNVELKAKSRELFDQVMFVDKDTDKETMFYNGRQLTPLSNSINEVVYNKTIMQDISMLLCDFWDDMDFQNTQHEGGVSFPNGKKPEELLYRIIKLATNEGDVILDYHLGSGTTAAVAHKMNRRYIGIEQLNYGENDSIIRLENVINGEQSGISKAVNWDGGGNFVYCELNKANQIFLEQIENATTADQLKKIWHIMQDEAFLSYKIDAKRIDAEYSSFEKLNLESQKQFLFEVLDKNMLYIPYSEIDNGDYMVSEEDKKLNKQFYALK